MSASLSCVQPLITIKLYGSLRQFGREFRLSVQTPAEAIRALCVQLPGFEKFLTTSKERGLEFAVFRGKRNITDDKLTYHGQGEIRIAPVIVGSKRAGILQTIVGVVLIVAASIATGGLAGAFAASAGGWGVVASAGAAMAIGGVVQMLSPQPKGLSSSAAPENTPGYAFGSAKNTTASGNPVPLCIGKRRWGGAVISASIYAEDKA